ncbi:ATP-grasp domain-containing protein [Kutzneria sp. NPDC052558]|uniref:ATP-grasp domain-containing protein n=1 Tax=Kutzneria sp. NPDC052558 TaxID=3364121 RepID=UPI0037C52486
MADRTLLVLGCASVTPHGRDQMRRLSDQARRRGVHVLGADTAANLAKADLSGLVGESVAVDVHSPAAVREWAATRVDIGAVLTFREMCVESVAAAAAVLGLAGNDPDVVRTVRTKDLCREALRAQGFHQPSCAVVADLAEAEAFLARTDGPWVVKPRDGMGSVGVSLVDGVSALPAALELLPAGVPFLIETFVSGPEFSAEGLFVGGRPVVLALTAKTTGAGFVETGHRMPASVESARAEVERAVTAVGLTHGVFHVEFWLDGTEIVLGEVHARPGGDFIHAMVEHVRPGLELYGALMDDLFGEPGFAAPEVRAAAGVEFLVLPEGSVLSVRGWDEVLADPAVIAADLSVRAGDVIGPVRGSADRHGVIVVGGADGPAVERTLRRLADSVSVEVA